MNKGNLSFLILWIHSSFAASSMAFFLAQMSATEATKEHMSILLASICISVSLVLNSGLAFLTLSFKEPKDMVRYVLLKKRVPLRTFKIAIVSFMLGIVFLVSYYSILATMLMVLVGFLVLPGIVGELINRFEEEIE
ncbi:TPA: hypothetical protein RQK51_004539, partial [Vibrio vulnificus]|nr:hypothetical protein [Vibrio vulnificus]